MVIEFMILGAGMAAMKMKNAFKSINSRKDLAAGLFMDTTVKNR